MFYEEGVKFACFQLGLTKEAVTPAQLTKYVLPAAGGAAGAVRGALWGGGVGGLTGALTSREGQGWEGFKRGLGRGALLGGAVGGLSGALRGSAYGRQLGERGVTDLAQKMRTNTVSPAETLAMRKEMLPSRFVPGVLGGFAGLPRE